MVHFIERMFKVECKKYCNYLRDYLITAGGRIYTDKHSGVTVAIEPAISGNNCKFFRVAVAYCNSNDKFIKSIGEAIALYRVRVNTARHITIRCESFNNTNERMEAIANNFVFFDY